MGLSAKCVAACPVMFTLLVLRILPVPVAANRAQKYRRTFLVGVCVAIRYAPLRLLVCPIAVLALGQQVAGLGSAQGKRCRPSKIWYPCRTHCRSRWGWGCCYLLVANFHKLRLCIRVVAGSMSLPLVWLAQMNIILAVIQHLWP